MARVERISSAEPVPVERAQLVDPSRFRFGAASAEALERMGRVLEELGRRKIEMQDRIGISNINAAVENAQREYEKEIIGKPLEEHAAILQKHKNNALALASKQRLTAEAREEADNKLEAWADFFTDMGEIANIKAVERDAIIRVTADYERALTEGIPEDIVEAEVALDEQFKNSYEPAEAKVLKEKAEQRAIKQMEDNALKMQMDKAAIKPKLMISYIDAELKARAKDKKAIQEFALLSNTDLEAIRDYAGSVGKKAISDSIIAFDRAIEDSYARIIGGDTDIASMITEIQTDPEISEEDSNKAADKIATFFSKWNSLKVADETDEKIYDELTRMSESVERGSVSPAAFEELYVDKKEFLTKEDQRSIRSKDIVATKTMQNRTFSEATTNTYSRLVELRDDELSGLIAARDNALRLKDLKTVNALNFSIKKSQVQKWNYGRFRISLRNQISQNEEWSQKQIFTAADILAEQYDKPIADLMLEFEMANPNRSILKTPPDDEFEDIWKDLPIEDKAKVWELRLAGATVKEILGAI